MPDTLVKDVTETRPGQPVATVDPNVAISFLPSFNQVKDILESSPAPRRPSRNQPIGDDEDTESIVGALIDNDALDFWGPEDDGVYTASDCIPE